MTRVTTETSDGVYTITLNRPDKRNAIDTPMVEELLQCLEHADLSADVRVIAIRGEGKDFCAGADLKELLASADLPSERNAENALHLGEVFIRIRKLPKPVVAVVHGRALAGGCGLATACDVVLARSDAQFGYPEITRGFVPAMVMTMLRRAVGEKTAFDLVATGRLLSAADAERLGLISRSISPGAFESEVADILRGFVGNSASALALIKKQLYELEGRTFEQSIRLGAEVNALARATGDFKKAVQGFLRKS